MIQEWLGGALVQRQMPRRRCQVVRAVKDGPQMRHWRKVSLGTVPLVGLQSLRGCSSQPGRL